MALTKAKRRLSAAGDDVRDKVVPALDDVRHKVVPALGDVKEKLTPSIDLPHVSLKPALHATGRVVPAVKLASAAQQRRTRNAAIKVKLVRRPAKPSHRLRSLLLLAVLGGIGYVAYRKFFGGGGGDTWADSGGGKPVSAAPVTTPKPTPPTPATPAPPAEPAEAAVPAAPSAPLASEETVESAVPTTPDEPLTETQVDTP